MTCGIHRSALSSSLSSMFFTLLTLHLTCAEWPRSAATALRLAELHLEADSRAGQAPASSMSPRPASPGGHSKPAPDHAPAGRRLHGCAANLGLVQLATLVAPGGPGAQPDALDLQQTLRQHWAAGRLAERCRRHSAAAGHFKAIVRLCTDGGHTPPPAGSSAPGSMEADAQQVGEWVERASVQAGGPAEAAACEPGSTAAPARSDAAGVQQVVKPGAEPASAQANGQAEAAAGTLKGHPSDGRLHARPMEIRLRAAGGGVESVISAAEALVRLEALQLHALLEVSLAEVCQLKAMTPSESEQCRWVHFANCRAGGAAWTPGPQRLPAWWSAWRRRCWARGRRWRARCTPTVARFCRRSCCCRRGAACAHVIVWLNAQVRRL